jgi:hypothetical protein
LGFGSVSSLTSISGKIECLSGRFFFFFEVNDGSIDGYTIHPSRKLTQLIEIRVGFPQLKECIRKWFFALIALKELSGME